jgi:C-terminal processing protease CtpA/Prc
MNSKKYPGNFFLDIRGEVGLKENPDYFKGKVAILVSETTQSFGELSAIAYRMAPRSAVIGTQTAGANGHVDYLFLPFGIKFTYSMAGAFYPDWGLNQRAGVKIDIPVEQTVKDVEEGEDMWIRKAIEYIETER